MSSSLKTAVLFRRRSGWEATDMGIFLWRTNFFPILLFMIIPLLFLFFINQIALKLNSAWSGMIVTYVIWWIKPLLDRLSLQVVSVRFFEPRAPLRRLFRGLGKTIWTGLAGDLLWRRASLYRSARMPLRVLERITGDNYKRRKQLLERNGLGFGMPLTFICIGMIMALNVGELIFFNSIFNMLEGSSRSLFDFIREENTFISIVYFFNIIIVETLYVCMGFSLYINSRVETEGWDIELLFKSCVEKNQKPVKPKTMFAIPVLMLFFFFAPFRSYAQEQQEQQRATLLKPAPVSQNAGETLEHILEDPKFGNEKESRHIQFKERKENQRWLFNFQINAPAREFFGKLLRFIVIAAIVTALGFAGYFAYRYRGRFYSASETGKNSIQNATQEECLTLLQQATELHRMGKIREGWALCFRAFITAFSKMRFFTLPPEATEYESLSIVRKNTANTESFEDFIRHWIVFAYGGKEPAAGSFEQAIISCRNLLETSGKPEGSE